jgi:hypothetical protein
VNALSRTYSQLARPWTETELAAQYREAQHRGAQSDEVVNDELTGPLSLVASAIPACATSSVAIHVIHALPDAAPHDLPHQLLATASRNTASALRRCHLALEQDGAAHAYTADEWLPVICDSASRVLLLARLDDGPPTAVEQAQNAIVWLSRSVVQLHDDSADGPTTISEALARLLVVWVFAELARKQVTA